MQSIVVLQVTTILLQLFTGKDKTQLVGRKALLVFNLRQLHVINGVGRLSLQCNDRASSQIYADHHGK